MQFVCNKTDCANFVQGQCRPGFCANLCKGFSTGLAPAFLCHISPAAAAHAANIRRHAHDQSGCNPAQRTVAAIVSNAYRPAPIIESQVATDIFSRVKPSFPERVSEKISELRKNASAEYATAGLPAADVTARPRLTANETGCAPRPAAHWGFCRTCAS